MVCMSIRVISKRALWGGGRGGGAHDAVLHICKSDTYSLTHTSM